MLVIQSNQNPKYKLLKKLKTKRQRIKEGLVILEGRRLVEHGISLGVHPEMICYTKDALALRDDSKDFILENALFNSVSDTVHSQGVIGVFDLGTIENSINPSSENLLILNGVQDPGNMGTIIRSADAFGFDKIICTKNTVDPYSDKALRSSMGGIFKVQMRLGFESKDLIRYLQSKSYAIIVSSLDADCKLSEVARIINKPFALVMGNEGSGVERMFLDAADISYKIQMREFAESLNVAAAAAISMYELGQVKQII